MRLFHAVSTYQLISLMAYAQQTKAAGKDILLVANTLADKYPQYQELTAFFDELYVFPLTVLPDEEISEEAIGIYFDDFLSERKINLMQVDTVHLGCPHSPFGIYLETRKIPYVFWEDAAGQLSRPEIMQSFDKPYPNKCKLAQAHGLYTATGDSVKAVMIDLAAQAPGFSLGRGQKDFRTVTALEALPGAIKEKIVRFFLKEGSISLPSNCVLMLTQHFANLQVLSFEEQALLYQIVMDYFFPQRTVVFKTHPDDMLYYAKLFPEHQVVNARFPSELLGLVFCPKPKEIATISSTAVKSQYGHFDEIFELGFAYEKLYTQTPIYDVALHFAVQTENPTKHSIACIGEGIDTLISALAKAAKICDVQVSRVSDLAQAKKHTAVIAGNLSKREWSVFAEEIHRAKETPRIFIPTGEGFLMDVPELEWMQSIVLEGMKEREDDFFAQDIPMGLLCVRKGKPAMRNEAGVLYHKMLQYTGLNIKVKVMSETENRLYLLEEMLRAATTQLREKDREILCLKNALKEAQDAMQEKQK